MTDQVKPDNAADQEAVADKERRVRMTRKTELDDLRHLLADPAFRRFLWRLFKRFGLFRLSYTGNSDTFFNEGRRNEGLWLLGEIASADPQAVGGILGQSPEDLQQIGGRS